MSFLDNLSWRFATKEFSDKPVSEADLNKILEAIHMTPTSRGLQPFHVYVISDRALKESLEPLSHNQKQITSCQYLLVFCHRTDMLDRATDYINLSSEHSEAEKAERIEKVHQSLAKKTPDEQAKSAELQTYIALGFALAAAAELKVDSCPMGGFLRNEYDKVLQLPDHIKSSVLLPLGYRKADPEKSKVRFPNSDLFSFLD